MTDETRNAAQALREYLLTAPACPACGCNSDLVVEVGEVVRFRTECCMAVLDQVVTHEA